MYKQIYTKHTSSDKYITIISLFNLTDLNKDHSLLHFKIRQDLYLFCGNVNSPEQV